MELVERRIETFAVFKIPAVDGLEELAAAAKAEIAGDNEAHIASGVSAAIMFANILELDVGEGTKTLLEVLDIFADRLLKTRPEETIIIVEIAGKLGFDCTLLGL